MSHRPSTARKRRTREHVIADLSVNFVERQALLCGFSMDKRIHDYGIDLVLSTFSDTGEIEEGEVLLQIKATDLLKLIASGRFVSYRIERADLRTWLVEPFPVILVVYDAQTERAFWLYVQAAFDTSRRFAVAHGSAYITVRIPIGQLVDPSAMRRFRAFRSATLEQMRGVIHRDV